MKNLLKILKSKIGIFGIILGIVFIAIPSYYFFDKQMIIGNFGYNYYLFELSLVILIALLFGIFFGASLYKIIYFSKIEKKSSIGIIGGFIGILVTGCPACSITLASYFGLASIISVLPFGGIELKIISVFLLLYVVFIIIRDLEVCKIKKNK